jgi:hypothetical protein
MLLRTFWLQRNILRYCGATSQWRPVPGTGMRSSLHRCLVLGEGRRDGGGGVRGPIASARARFAPRVPSGASGDEPSRSAAGTLLRQIAACRPPFPPSTPALSVVKVGPRFFAENQGSRSTLRRFRGCAVTCSRQTAGAPIRRAARLQFPRPAFSRRPAHPARAGGPGQGLGQPRPIGRCASIAPPGPVAGQAFPLFPQPAGRRRRPGCAAPRHRRTEAPHGHSHHP